jgi:hypothetical protein
MFTREQEERLRDFLLNKILATRTNIYILKKANIFKRILFVFKGGIYKNLNDSEELLCTLEVFVNNEICLNVVKDEIHDITQCNYEGE